MKRDHLYIFYCVLFLGFCLAPFVGLLFTGPGTTPGESGRLAVVPALKDENGLNTNLLSDAGKWYEDNFGFRSEMVTAGARLDAGLFGVSSSDQVITGTNGWLYYADSLDDYQGTGQLTDREIFCIAHNLAMMEQKLSLMKIRFVFAVAPNKNTLYPGHMPYYYQVRMGDEDNLTRLENALRRENVSFVSLKDMFTDAIAEGLRNGQDGQADPPLFYHLRDSHWNNIGASMAAAKLLECAGKEHAAWKNMSPAVQDDFVGDLDSMLFPTCPTPEKEYRFAGITDVPFDTMEDHSSESLYEYRYLEEVQSNFEPVIRTASDRAEGSAAVFRDSFGNSLLPFIASSFRTAFFGRGVPYQASDIYANNADTVMIIRAQRFIPDLLKNPPVMEGLPVFDGSLLARLARQEAVTVPVSVSQTGYLQTFRGNLDRNLLHDETRVFCRSSDGLYYEAFLTGSGDGKGDEFVFFLQSGILREDEEISLYLL